MTLVITLASHHGADRFLKRQRPDGIVEEWHGDGNYVRTALMYALMKSQGAWAEPWRPDLSLGAVREGSRLVLALEAATPWAGRVRFDTPRHRTHFFMPLNYPRQNEFPEWFTVEADRLYRVRVGEHELIRLGGELIRGIEVDLEAGTPRVLEVTDFQR